MTGIPEEQDWEAYPPGAAPQYSLAPGYGPPSGYGVPGYGPPSGYGVPGYGPPSGYGVPGYGPPSGYGVPGYGPPSGYGVPGYGPPPGHGSLPGPGPLPYGSPPGYGPPLGYGWFPFPPLTWPAGPGRPHLATTAAVLGYVTAGLTILVSGALFIGVLYGEDDPVSLLLTLGLPCAAGLVAGGVRLQARRSPALLLGSALAAVVVLLLALLAGAVTIDRTDGMEGLTVFVLAGLVLPGLTAVFSWARVVREWAAARPD